MEVYLVGGAVRDSLLNRPVTERDWVVVGGSPEDMLKRRFQQVGKDFPVFLHPETGEEYALARTERKTGRGYSGFACYSAPDVTLEQDLQRRDLTINAIAQRMDGTLIDPYGGQEDIKKKVLRHVSLAFIEDPLRILRVARFQARFAHLGFTIAKETASLMKNMVDNGEANYLVPERIWQETERALGEQSPAQFIQVLRDCKASAIIFPEIDCLFGVPNPSEWHPEIDTGIHTLMVLEQAVRLGVNVKTRFAVLLHDLGKGVTPKEVWPHHPGHEEQGVKLIEALCKRLRVPKDFKELAIITSRYHTHVHKAFELTAKTIVNTLERVDAFRRPERFAAFLLACEADSRGRTGFEDKAYPQRDFFMHAYEAANAVSITPLLERGLQGPSIAEELHQLRVLAVKHLISNQ